MSHLQECQLFLEPMLPAQDWCICQQLRACEQRVLDAAQEAVRTIASDYLCCMCPTDEGLTLAAIDALREEQK